MPPHDQGFSSLSRLAKEAFSQFDKNNSGNIDQKVNPKSPLSLRVRYNN